MRGSEVRRSEVAEEWRCRSWTGEGRETTVVNLKVVVEALLQSDNRSLDEGR